MAFDYSQNRFAFGRAIGSFQTIKHKLVNILMTSNWRVETLITAPGQRQTMRRICRLRPLPPGYLRLNCSTMRRGKISKRMAAWASPGRPIVVYITGARNNCRWRLEANGAGLIA